MKKFALAVMFLLSAIVASAVMVVAQTQPPVVEYRTLDDKIKDQQALLEQFQTSRSAQEETIRQLDGLLAKAREIEQEADDAVVANKGNRELSINEYGEFLDVRFATEQVRSTLETRIARAREGLNDVHAEIRRVERELKRLNILQAAARIIHDMPR